LKYYGTSEPPQYNLSAITAPISLYNGENDWLSTPEVRTKTCGKASVKSI